MKRFLLGTGLAAIVAGPAMTADLAVRAPVYKAPPPVAVFSWTGCYIGGNLGGGWSRSNFTTVFDRTGPPRHLNLQANLDAISAAGTGSANDSGNFIGGGQVGCNWQSGAFVFGLEADIDAFRASATLRGTGVLTTGDTFAITNSVRTNWLATVRPRLGVAFDRSLLYVTGGLAVTDISYTQTYSDTLFAAVGASVASQTKAGWTAGGGWEYAFTNNWSGKIEYLYAQFSSIRAFGTVVDVLGGTNVMNGSADLREHIVRVGLNYKFDWAPVMAKY